MSGLLAWYFPNYPMRISGGLRCVVVDYQGTFSFDSTVVSLQPTPLNIWDTDLTTWFNRNIQPVAVALSANFGAM